MQPGDTDGVLAFSIDFGDANTNTGLQVTATTDASSVVYDESIPSVTNVDSTVQDGTYYTSDTVEITVIMSEVVSVNTGGGSPRLLLETGSTNRYAGYTGGSGSDILTFRYTVQRGDSSSNLDYTATTSLELNGSVIVDAAANNADLTLSVPGSAGSLGANKNIAVNGLLSDEQGDVIIRNNIINPSRGEETILNYRLDQRSSVTITVYDLAGDPVKTLFRGTAGPGMNEVSWDGKSRRGRAVVQGVYLIVVKIEKDRHVRKVLVVK
jgi:hypothetical protein